MSDAKTYALPYVELRAFHGEEAVKAVPVNRLKQLNALDELRIDSYNYNASQYTLDQLWEYTYLRPYARVLGIPAHLAAAENIICRHLPEGDAARFAIEFLERIPVGAQLAYVFPRLGVWMIENTHLCSNTQVVHAPSQQTLQELALLCKELPMLASEETYTRLMCLKEECKSKFFYISHRHEDEEASPETDLACFRYEEMSSLCSLMESVDSLEDVRPFLHRLFSYKEAFPGYGAAVRDKLLSLIAEAPVPESAP